MAIDWDSLRESEFPVIRRWAYFDHAATAPLPRRAGEAFRAWAVEQENDGVIGWPEREKRVEQVRTQAATLLNAERDEIAFVNSTTHGIGLIAEGFPWRSGDSVVTAEDEYPSNLYPWMNLASRGVSVRQVTSRDGRIEIGDLAAAMDRSTRVLAISHVEFATGFRNDLDALGELCRERGVALFVDAIQGLGALPVDVKRTPIDFLAADGHKWLLGPEGAGILFIRREWLDRLRATGVGWHSVVGSYNSPRNDFVLKPSAARFEGGSFNMPGLLALGASLSLFLELGPDVVSERIMDRAAAVREVAVSCGYQIFGSARPADQSAIVVLESHGRGAGEIASGLRGRGVVAACRRGRLRLSPHLYNNSDDMEKLRDGLSALAKSSTRKAP